MRSSVVFVAFVALALACSAPPPQSNCGNGAVQTPEYCDGTDLRGATCELEGFGAGTLRCRADCSGYDRSACGAPLSCGNGSLEGVETCDGTLLGSATCESLGYGAGTLKCSTNCAEYDTSSCGAPATCNNGQKDGVEACDGTDLGGASCQSMGLGSGTLRCGSNCAYDTTGCQTSCVPNCAGVACGNDPVCNQPCPDTCSKPFTYCDAANRSCKTVCDFPLVSADQTVNIDLKAVTITGALTLDGGTPPATTGSSRGALRFKRLDSGGSVAASLGTTGAASYSQRLLAGDYDVMLESSDKSIFPGPNWKLGGGSWNANATFNADVKAVRVSGALTVNGAAPGTTTSSTRGWLYFRSTLNSTVESASLGTSGAASYSLRIIPGEYEVSIQSNDETAIPGPSTTLGTFTLNADTAKSFDLAAVTISGAVTLNGAAPATTTASERGVIVFRNKARFTSVQRPVPASGASTYSVRLIPGDYEVLFDSSDGTVFPEPYVSLGDFTFNANGTPAFDIKSITVTGSITLNGTQPGATTTTDRGDIIFTRKDTGRAAYFTLPASGAATYTLKLSPGEYEVSLDTNDENIFPGPTAKLGSFTFSQHATQNFDVKAFTLSGALTVSGAQPPTTASANRGTLRFVRAETGSWKAATLPASAAANYSVRLTAGAYDVMLASNDTASIPGPYTRVGRGIQVNANATQSFDVKAFTVSGAVTLNGAVPGSTTLMSRGSVLLTNKFTGQSVTATLTPSGAANFSTKVIAGPYDVTFSSADLNVIPGPNAKVKNGCLVDAAGCTADLADATGSWFISTSVPSYGLWNVDLVQSGTTITGTWSNDFSQSGKIENGVRNGNTITFLMNGGYYLMTATLNLAGPCMVTGDFKCNVCSPSSGTVVGGR